MYNPTLPKLLVLLALCGACKDDPSTKKDSNDSDTGGDTVEGPCESVFEDDYFIRDQAELNALTEYCEVTGSLVVYNSSLTAISLPKITAVGGNLSVLSNTSLISFSLPNLRSVSGDTMVESNDVLISFDLSALTEIGEGQFNNVWVKHNDALTSFDLSALTRVSGSLFIRFNGVQTSFDLSALAGLGGYLGVTDNDALAQCLVDALVVQIEAAEGIGDGVDTTGGPNNASCTCEEIDGVLEATCP